MSARVFVDSNILIYAHDLDAGPKRHIAESALSNLGIEGTGVLSPRIVTTAEDVAAACRIGAASKISFWHALIVASAIKARATTVLSEDRNACQRIAGVLIENPFANS